MVNHKIEAAAIKTTLEESQRILVVAHKKPDGDTLGSSLAWHILLSGKGKSVDVFCLDPAPDHLLHLTHIQHLSTDAAIFNNEYDVIIVNDSGDLEYAGVDTFLQQRDNSNTTLINIDHHATNPLYGDLNLVIPTASSNTEILTRLFMHWDEELTRPLAENLLHGIITDTESFSNPATSYQALITASELVRAGADIHSIIHRTLYTRSIRDLKLLGLMLSRLKKNEAYGIITSYITLEDLREHDATLQSIEGFANYMTLIPGVNAFIFLTQMDEHHIKGSLRSIKDSVDVGELAKALGGGGHKKASGFKLKGKLTSENGNWTIN